MSAGKFKVLKASAGSGKTYALVKEYLYLALGSRREDYYRHILAITFTNAAAAEMKERVLKMLRNIGEAAPGSEGLTTELSEKIKIDATELATRALATYRHMLHHYGWLAISTIDSFTHRLVRSFSRDLHISHDFTIQLDAGEFLEAVVDQCLDLIGEDEEITDYIRQFTLDNLEDEKAWNPRESILKMAKELMEEDAPEALKKLDGYSLKDFVAIRKEVYAKQQTFKNYLRDLSEKVSMLLAGKNLVMEDFPNAGKGSISFFQKLSGDKLDKPGANFYKLMEASSWARKGIEDWKVAAIEEIQPQLLDLFRKTDEALSDESLLRYRLRSSVLSGIYSIGLLHKLFQVGIDYKKEENILLIKDLHELIGSIVNENDAPFIYERIGQRYRHILFDEFQDTSVLQWSNMVPLIQNALGENHLNLIVGDGKQSIYRWRGGRAEQFVNLPEIQIGGVHQSAETVFRQQYYSENLEFNFRSAKSIIDFNNLLYESLGKKIEGAQKIYADQGQKFRRDQTGFVRVVKIKGSKKEDRWTFTSAEILKCIQESVASGYLPGDIAILTRKSAKEAGIIAEFLTENGYQVATMESLLIRNSPKVRAIAAYIEFLLDKENQYAKIELAKAVSEAFPELSFTSFMEKHVSHLEKKLLIDIDAWLASHFSMVYENKGHSDLVTIITDLAAYFRFETDMYLEFFLEQARRQENNAHHTLMQWTQWWKEHMNELYITSSPDPQAIRIMTIHKSKGLQFPVVVYPRFSSIDFNDDIWIETDEKEFGLPVALVSKSIQGGEEIPAITEEKNKTLVDDLNLCYVATTRAEDRLYIIAETGKSGFGTLFDKTIEEVFEPYKKEEDHWTIGTEETVIPKAIHDTNHILNYNYSEREKLVFREGLPEKEEKHFSFGNILHETLAALTPQKISHNGIVSVISDLTHDAETAQRIQVLIEELLQKASTLGWFDAGNESFTEREIVNEKGELFRPDRVVIKEDHIDVIDYKTGQPEDHHTMQVKQYANLIADFYSKKANAYVVYFSDTVSLTAVG